MGLVMSMESLWTAALRSHRDWIWTLSNTVILEKHGLELYRSTYRFSIDPRDSNVLFKGQLCGWESSRGQADWLYADFWLHEKSAPQMPMLFKGQLYYAKCDWPCPAQDLFSHWKAQVASLDTLPASPAASGGLNPQGTTKLPCIQHFRQKISNTVIGISIKHKFQSVFVPATEP